MPREDEKTPRDAAGETPRNDERDDHDGADDLLDPVDQAIDESFPASDAPSFTPGQP